ncbi:kunitz-type serine protease inhibitor LmKTT-1c-like [Drosophila sulfurigaster albostrigata]|uniref:kunitz-type serine protease inhibitor LmKTT-1c-like n=1 Tax=Drosophila sulfurigaster albostrigata TaxID=89887 RepID=UPI002D21E99A|nr:kunitz-type serine protease inhibitor LmKTT-1c-like [Drosophila sulfurigaster albostrigata]
MNCSLVWIFLILRAVHSQAQGECLGTVSPADPKCFPDRDIGHTKRSYCSRNANNVMWYYDSSSGSCRAFAYKGCGGNKNRFCTWEDCVKECKGFDKA